ncbi:MAG: response regulator [Candidatus Aminicenantes bacterium]|nr:MAG: response regulator [Candidatus Aminicenantes bacterium]
MNSQNPKILIVEDENIIALDIRSMLEDLGYMVSAIVSSGEESIKEASKMKPDLVIMDVKLKGNIDGVSAGEEIYKQFRIPIVYLTAYSDKATISRINNGKNGKPSTVINKPFDEGELQSVIDNTLAH